MINKNKLNKINIVHNQNNSTYSLIFINSLLKITSRLHQLATHYCLLLKNRNYIVIGYIIFIFYKL